jgi:hypothetical protein
VVEERPLGTHELLQAEVLFPTVVELEAKKFPTS